MTKGKIQTNNGSAQRTPYLNSFFSCEEDRPLYCYFHYSKESQSAPARPYRAYYLESLSFFWALQDKGLHPELHSDTKRLPSGWTWDWRRVLLISYFPGDSSRLAFHSFHILKNSYITERGRLLPKGYARFVLVQVLLQNNFSKTKAAYIIE